MEAQRGPVTIEKNGMPVAVVESFEEHQERERLKLDWLRAADRGEACRRGRGQGA
jgi:PHD/YefM family antitoxin component YafN of YafNO toxin-antitoxin module